MMNELIAPFYKHFFAQIVYQVQLAIYNLNSEYGEPDIALLRPPYTHVGEYVDAMYELATPRTQSLALLSGVSKVGFDQYSALHLPMFDIDQGGLLHTFIMSIPEVIIKRRWYVLQSSPGRFHVLSDTPVTWGAYVEALVTRTMVDTKFAERALRDEYGALRISPNAQGHYPHHVATWAFLGGKLQLVEQARFIEEAL